MTEYSQHPELLIRIDERQKEIIRHLNSQDERLLRMEERIQTIESYVQRWKWASSALIGLGAAIAWIISILAPSIKKWIA